VQTLNVGAGQSDQEYKAAEQQRRADLVADSRSDANFFFWAAGLAALGTGLLPVRLNILVSIGVVDLLTLYGRPLGQLYPVGAFGAAIIWVVALVGLGFAARSGHRWAFVVGMILYAADMVGLIVLFSLWAFGVHAWSRFCSSVALFLTLRTSRLSVVEPMSGLHSGGQCLSQRP
jgi:hypothetical protein